MEKIIDSLSTREIAFISWTLLIIIPFLFFSNIRKSSSNVVSSFFAKKLFVIFLSMTIYATGIILFLKYINLWNVYLLKDSLIWYFTFAFVTLFKVVNSKTPKVFIKLLNESFKLILFLEFVSNFYTFSLWIEMLTVPLMLLISMLKIVSEKEENNRIVTNLLSTILTICGFSYFGFAIYKTLYNYTDIININNLKTLVLPCLLTFFSLPYFYLVALYSNYEQLFLRIRIMSNDKLTQDAIKKQIIFKAKFSIKKVNVLRDKLMHFDLYEVTDIRDKLNSILKTSN